MNYALTPKRIDWLIDWLVSNANFSNISAISWCEQIVLLLWLSVPDEGYSSNVPDDGYSSNVPDEGYSSNVPDEGYSSNVPDEGYSRNASCALSLISTFLLDTYKRGHHFKTFHVLKGHIFTDSQKIRNKCIVVLI